MHKRKKNLILCFIILVIVVAAFAIIKLAQNDESAQLAKAENNSLSALGNDQLVKIAYSNDHGNFSFVYDGENWAFKDDTTLPIDQKFIKSIVDRLDNINVIRDITEDASVDEEYGFDDPSAVITLCFDNGEEKYVTVGSTTDNGEYTKVNSRIILAQKGLLASCSYDIYDIVSAGEMLSLNLQDVVSFEINGVVYESKDIISALIDEYNDISLNSVVAYNGKENYGFDSQENVITIKYNTVSASDEKNEAQNSVKEFSFSFAEKNGNEYLMLLNEPLIYLSNGCSDLLITVD